MQRRGDSPVRYRRRWRASGSGGWFYYLLGLGLIGVAVFLHLHGASDTVVIVLVGAGLTVLPGSHALEALRAWRGGGYGADLPLSRPDEGHGSISPGPDEP